MNPLIRKQLENCKVASIPFLTGDESYIHIPKGSVLTVTPYQVGKCYIVELADFVLNPSEASTLSSNWNKGTTPKHKYYKCEIVKLVGKMICILGYALDETTGAETSDLWEGWVPQAGIKLLRELN